MSAEKKEQIGGTIAGVVAALAVLVFIGMKVSFVFICVVPVVCILAAIYLLAVKLPYHMAAPASVVIGILMTLTVTIVMIVVMNIH